MNRTSTILLVGSSILLAVGAGYTLAKLPTDMRALANADAHDSPNEHTAPQADGHEHEDGAQAEPKHKSHEEDGDNELSLTPGQIKLAEIETVQVATEDMAVMLTVTGEVTANQDRLADVVPLISGTAQQVNALLGTQVKQGEIMAVIDSRELADAKSAWIAARERTLLVESKHERDQRLWSKRIISEQEFLDSRTALAEARIGQRSAEHKLRALGYSAKSLPALAKESGISFTRYDIRAPIDGTVIGKHVTTGEFVDLSQPIYRVADLSTMWIIASVYEKDYARVRKDQVAKITSHAYPDQMFEGRVTWISDTIDEETRTLKVRIEVDNRHRNLRPGMFITAELAVDYRRGAITVPISALQRGKGEDVVFVAEAAGRFDRREVRTGIKSGDRVEILSGLKSDERVVSTGSFILRSEMEKGGFEAGHGH